MFKATFINSKVYTTEMKTLRTRADFTLRQEKCQVEDMIRWVRKRRCEWNDQVSRMSDNRLTRIARDSNH